MPQKSRHYWRIHARVCKRLWTDLPQATRDVIAADVAHETQTFRWFTSKVEKDSEKLYEDENYYDNQEFTFRHPKNEPLPV